MNQPSILNFSVLWQYCAQRFPLPAYTVLVAIFFGSSQLVLLEGFGEGKQWLGGIVLWLVFFHLRIFDEFKDFEEDRWHYPERVLSQGKITLGVLGQLGIIVIFLEAGLSYFLGSMVFFAWLGAFVFSVLMRIEFGASTWLQQNLLLYAITHNPIVAALAIVAWACSGAVWSNQYLWYVLSVSIASLGFELARKIRQPNEEIAGVQSYTSVYGMTKSLMILRLCTMISAFAAGMVLWEYHSNPWGWGILVVATIIGLLPHKNAPAKKIELLSTLFLLLSMLAMGAGLYHH